MALIADSTTTEVILLVIGLFLFDGGLIRKFGSIGMFVYGLGMTLVPQTYVSDLSASPQNVFLAYTGNIQNGLGWIFIIMIMITVSLSFISIWRIIKFAQQGNKLTLTLIMEEIV